MALALPSPAGNPRAGGQYPHVMPETFVPGVVPDESPEAMVPEDPTPKKKYEGADLALLVSWFEDAEEMTYTARRESERDRDYYDNKQLTAQERAILEARGQPAVIINRIQTKVNYLKGYEASQRSDPRAFPRTPMDEDAAEAATDALRYVADKAKISQAYSSVWENMLVEGFGGLEIVPHPNEQGDAEFEVRAWPWDRLFYDPYSRQHDFSDARYLGGVIWMDYEEALAKWPTAKEAINRTLDGERGSTYDDRPVWRKWAANGRRRRVRICQMYYKRNDVWHWCIFTEGGKIDGGEVPYKDEDGKSLCPMILQSAFVDRENQRYGFVRALISPQDEINKRRSKMLHEASVRQFVYEDGAIEDVDRTKTELARPDGGIKVAPDMRFELLDRSKEIAAHTALQQEAKQEIELMGPNAAMQGKGERDASGRAILANQQGGQIEITALIDRHKHLKMRAYETIWALIRMYWTAQKWVRVTDEDKNSKFAMLNAPVTMAEKLLEEAANRGIDSEQAKEAMRRGLEANPDLQFQLEQVVETKRVPAEMSMDIILEEVPDTANMQQEQFEILVNLARAGVQLPPKVYILASGLRNKRELIEELEQGQQLDPAAQAANELAVKRAETEIMKMLSEIDRNRAAVLKDEAAAIKTKVEADMMDAQIGQIVNPQIVDIGGGLAQLPDGQIMQQDGQGGVQPMIDPNQEAQRAFEADQAEAARQAEAQARAEGISAEQLKQAADIRARQEGQMFDAENRARAQQVDLSARERSQMVDIESRAREAEAARQAEAQRRAAEAQLAGGRPTLDQLYRE
jgi:hypothetical protein